MIKTHRLVRQTLTALALLRVVFVFSPPLHAEEPLAITAADVDPAASRSIHEGKSQPVNADLLLELLGVQSIDHDVSWRAGEVQAGKDAEFQFIVVFKRPIAFGSLYMFGTSQGVSRLAAGASPTADPADAKAWIPLVVPAHQSGAVLVPSPRDATQALLFATRINNGYAEIRSLRLFIRRLQNTVPGATAYASHEFYRKPADFTPPFLFAASRVTNGTGDWESAGENGGRIYATPISDVLPEWFMLAWDKPQTIDGLWLHGSVRRYTLEYFAGADSVSPRAGVASEWKSVKSTVETQKQGRWIAFEKPIATRGLRLTITKVDGRPMVAIIDGLHAFHDLGDAPAETYAPDSDAAAPPPFAVPYKLNEAGNLTLVINDEQGNRARNIIGRLPVKAGPGVAGWDLRDEKGLLVTPGEYRWVAATCPQIQTKYEFTVYPNIHENAPENSGWLNGASGSGGWLADHCNNSAVCVVGDRVVIGAYMAVSGVALIECDLQGRKKWGLQGFAAWTGVGRLASDGKTLFNVTQMDGVDRAWGVDIESRQVRDVLTLPPTATRKRGNQGIAARDGKLYLSMNAQPDWLGNALAAEDVDLPSCVPVLPPTRKPKNNSEITANVRGDFVRLDQ